MPGINGMDQLSEEYGYPQRNMDKPPATRQKFPDGTHVRTLPNLRKGDFIEVEDRKRHPHKTGVVVAYRGSGGHGDYYAVDYDEPVDGKTRALFNEDELAWYEGFVVGSRIQHKTIPKAGVVTGVKPNGLFLVTWDGSEFQDLVVAAELIRARHWNKDDCNAGSCPDCCLGIPFLTPEPPTRFNRADPVPDVFTCRQAAEQFREWAKKEPPARQSQCSEIAEILHEFGDQPLPDAIKNRYKLPA